MAQTPRSADVQFKAAQHEEEVEGDLKGAIELYRTVAEGGDRALAARALIRMGESYEKLGNVEAKEDTTSASFASSLIKRRRLRRLARGW